MIASERERVLLRVALFGDLNAEELRALAGVSQPVRFPDAALISARAKLATASANHPHLSLVLGGQHFVPAVVVGGLTPMML